MQSILISLINLEKSIYLLRWNFVSVKSLRINVVLNVKYFVALSFM